MPVLEDDAVLFSLDDIRDRDTIAPELTGQGSASAQVEELREELARLQLQFAAYRKDVQKTLRSRLDEDAPPTAGNSLPDTKHATSQANSDNKDETAEHGYFSAYSYNEIHESMLKDTIRTDGYRDFIYDHKHLFAGKTVLDVGCGTGILSMFCAKAGAKAVIAVDNSGIIDKARQNIFENGFQDVIRCVRGKIEEVTLPVLQVDVIVSEWMGYCLLYESMLDSVLFARDKYLARDGLMVPSHAILRIAPLADSELTIAHVDFWKSVYGFKMTSMLENVYDEALIRPVDSSELAAESAAFLELDLHTAKTTDLTFLKSFQLSCKRDLNRLEGFILWFDIFFMLSQQKTMAKDLTTKQARDKGLVAFSTAPHATQTHWQQGVLLIKEPSAVLREGEIINGTIGFQRKEGHERSLDIEVRWKTPAAAKAWTQVWSLE